MDAADATACNAGFAGDLRGIPSPMKDETPYACDDMIDAHVADGSGYLWPLQPESGQTLTMTAIFRRVHTPPMNDDAEAKRAAIRDLMARKGLKLSSWCKKAGISRGSLRAFLEGNSRSMTTRTIQQLANAADVTVAELLGGNPPALVHVIADQTSEGFDEDVLDMAIKKVLRAHITETMGHLESEHLSGLSARVIELYRRTVGGKQQQHAN